MPNRILPPEELQRATPKLPAPWVHLGVLDFEKFDALELAAGSTVSPDDLTEDERSGRTWTRRAREALARQWVKIQNTENELIVYLRLQGAEVPEAPTERVSSVVVPFQPGKDLTGADLRSIPVQAITAAYSAHKDEGNANMLRTLQLAGALDEDPLEKLPAAVADDNFSARVARQYVEIERRSPGSNPIDEMVSINSAARSSVQRWVTRARKRGFLPPAIQGRRNG